MKSLSSHPPLGRTAFIACCALALPIVFNPACANATICDPVISLPFIAPGDTSASIEIEVPAYQPIAWYLQVTNLGCAPLDWKVLDAEPGTQLDCPWVSETPQSGSVPPAGSEPGHENLSIVMGPLTGGTFECELRFTSNDPVRPRIVLLFRINCVAPTATRSLTFGQLKARFRSAPARH